MAQRASWNWKPAAGGFAAHMVILAIVLGVAVSQADIVGRALVIKIGAVVFLTFASAHAIIIFFLRRFYLKSREVNHG